MHVFSVPMPVIPLSFMVYVLCLALSFSCKCIHMDVCVHLLSTVLSNLEKLGKLSLSF